MAEKETMRTMAAHLRRQANDILAATQTMGAPELREKVALINRAAIRMLRGARELELLGRLEDEDEIRLREEPVELVSWWSETARMAGGVLSQGEVALACRCVPSFLVTMGDKELLSQMALAMVAGAAEEVGRGGRLVLTLEELEGRACLRVENGRGGLDLKHLAPVDPGAADLGTALAAHIAALHGGVLLEGEGGTMASLPLRERERTTLLRTPAPAGEVLGGFSPALVALSEVLPPRAFVPETLE